MSEKTETLRESIAQYQFEVICGLLNHPEMASEVTPHLFAGSPASVCIVKAIKRGARGLDGICAEAAKIAKTSLVRFPVLATIEMAFRADSMRRSCLSWRIAELKRMARKLYVAERSESKQARQAA